MSPFFTTEYFQTAALKWLGDMLGLLKKHCLDERIAINFQYPDRQAGVAVVFPESWNKRFREEYPYILRSEWVRFAAFYRLRIEDLDKMNLSSCK